MAGNFENRWGTPELQHLKGKSVGDLLAQLPGGFVKTYGSGSLATASIQGMSASQTQVTWMGVPVNSPSLGMTDLALFPTELIGNATVLTGSAAQASGSGALGGVIALGSPQYFHYPSEWVTNGSLSAGSFGRYDGSLHVKKGFNRWYSETRAVYKQAENNYPYRDLSVFGTPERVLEHAAFRQMGVAQDWGFKPSSRQEWNAHIWLLDAQRQIPPIMGSATTEEQQHDQNLRAALSLTQSWMRLTLTHTATYLQDLNHYQNPTYGIDGLNRFRSMVAQSQFSTDRHTSQKWIFSGYARYRLDQSQTDGWEGLRKRQTGTAYARALWLASERWNMSVAMQQEMVDGKAMPTLPLWGMKYSGKPKEGAHLVTYRWVYANLGRNFRMPTLNDLYWVPGGNSQLKPEKSWKAQLGAGLTLSGTPYETTPVISLRGELFASHVRDWILWQPSGLGYWQAQNVQEVFARGGLVEFFFWNRNVQPVEGSYGNKFWWELRANYSHTRSEAIPAGQGILGGEGKQLIYVPRHTAQARLHMQWHRWQAHINPSYTGIRYITSDESQSLEGFFLLDASVSVGVSKSQSAIRLSLQGENLLNAEYQAVAFRPMAGRSALLRLDWNLNFNKSIK